MEGGARQELQRLVAVARGFLQKAATIGALRTAVREAEAFLRQAGRRGDR